MEAARKRMFGRELHAGLRIRIRIIFGIWIRIHIREKSGSALLQSQNSYALEAQKSAVDTHNIEDWRLKMEPGRSIDRVVADSHN
jgi:hypothetical protein